MNIGLIIFVLLVCGAILARMLKERIFLYCMACGMFLLGALAAGSGLLAGVRGNHWEVLYRRGSDSWYQEIGLGIVLIAGSIYLSRLDWPKKDVLSVEK